MRSASLRSSWLALLALLGVLMPGACSAADSDCTCGVDYGGERRTLVCGQSACVAGNLLSCTEANRIVQRGPCSTTPSPTPTDAGTTTDPPSPTDERSCQDLLAYCNTSCSEPASAAADCLATASAGDPVQCATWPLSYGVLCQP